LDEEAGRGAEHLDGAGRERIADEHAALSHGRGSVHYRIVIRRTAADDSQALPFRLVRAGGEHRLLARTALLEVNGRSVDEAALESFLSDERRYLLLALERDRPSHT